MENSNTILQANLLWTGIEYYSLENCIVSRHEGGYEINSVIIGYYENKIYRVNYLIRTSVDWITQFVDIVCNHANRTQKIQLEKNENENWLMNGVSTREFAECIDVDIPLTPFTNSLPINRLKLSTNEARQIKVIYIDLLQNRIRSVYQNYIRLSDSAYHYENVPNDFEAVINVDDQGFVSHYPELFTRKAKSS